MPRYDLLMATLAGTGRLKRLWIDAQEWGLGRMDRLAECRRRGPAMARHLAVGLRGERAALFELRRRGYLIVAQRWTSGKVRGDVDLIGWQGAQLCFIEVKTRTARDMAPAHSAVDDEKRDMLRGLARVYLQAFPEPQRRSIAVRFDVVSVYLLAAGPEFEVFEGTFSWR